MSTAVITPETNAAAIAEIWDLLRESARQSAKWAEESRLRAEEARQWNEEARQQNEETRKNIEAMRESMRVSGAETDRRIKELADKINKLEGTFGNRWGRLVEVLVEPGALQIFKERGIDVHHKAQNLESQRDGDEMEIDLLLENGTEIVVVEVKSKVSNDDVNDFLERLSRVHFFFPKYKDYTIYGAIAGLDINRNIARNAYKRGLFVLAVGSDNTVRIQNDDKFRPRNFSQYQEFGPRD
ncbi:MAG: DUF3782 domain-containing protein [Chloroflexota bacterium]